VREDHRDEPRDPWTLMWSRGVLARRDLGQPGTTPHADPEYRGHKRDRSTSARITPRRLFQSVPHRRLNIP
jgi:hypothetical protein